MKLRSKDIKAGASILRMEFAMADSQETAQKGPQAFASDWPNILERKKRCDLFLKIYYLPLRRRREDTCSTCLLPD